MPRREPLSHPNDGPRSGTGAKRYRRTPLLTVEVEGRTVVLKLEYLQRSGSFKLRGDLNALLSSPIPAMAVTASGGNHGLGVATVAGDRRTVEGCRGLTAGCLSGTLLRVRRASAC